MAQPMKFLVVEEPYKEAQYYPWDLETRKKFGFDREDIQELQESKIVWRADTAFSLEEHVEDANDERAY